MEFPRALQAMRTGETVPGPDDPDDRVVATTLFERACLFAQQVRAVKPSLSVKLTAAL